MRVLRFLIYSFPIMSINYSVSHRNRIDNCIYKVYTHCVCFRCSMKIYLEQDKQNSSKYNHAQTISTLFFTLPPVEKKFKKL